MKLLIFTSLFFSFTTTFAVNRPLSEEDFKKNIVFESGSGKLTLDQQISLIKIIQGLEKRGADLKITLASWSDKISPNDESQNFKNDQKELARERLLSVIKYIKQIGFFGEMVTYNMADLPTEERLNKTLLKKKFNLIKRKGGAGKVALIITSKK